MRAGLLALLCLVVPAHASAAPLDGYQAYVRKSLADWKVPGAAIVVVKDGHLLGLLTLHEVKGVPRDRWSRATVEEVMQPARALSMVKADENLLSAFEKMDNAQVAQLPVVDDGQWLGMLDREHILHYMRVRAELGV